MQIYPNPQLAELADIIDILNIGEATAIKLALNHNYPLFIDEKLGRSANNVNSV